MNVPCPCCYGNWAECPYCGGEGTVRVDEDGVRVDEEEEPCAS